MWWLTSVPSDVPGRDALLALGRVADVPGRDASTLGRVFDVVARDTASFSLV